VTPNRNAAAWIVCAAALLSFVALAIGDIVAMSPTTDEGVHLASGYAYLTGSRGMADPRYYAIAYHNLQSGYWAEPQVPPAAAVTPGYLAIDADRLHGLGMRRRSFWPEFLAQDGATEVGRAGYPIFIYRIE